MTTGLRSCRDASTVVFATDRIVKTRHHRLRLVARLLGPLWLAACTSWSAAAPERTEIGPGTASPPANEPCSPRRVPHERLVAATEATSSVWDPWFPEAAFGLQGNHGGEYWVVGVTAEAAFETSPSDDLFARLIGRINYDENAQHIDDDRHALWTEGRLLFGTLPLGADVAVPGFRFGLRGDFTRIDNTPTSVDRSLRLVGGFAVHYTDVDTHIALLAGGHDSRVEIDDELPRLQGLGRERLESRHQGLAAAGTLQHALADWLIVATTARVLFDQDNEPSEVLIGAALDLPLSLPSAGGAYPCLRVSAEERYFDSDARSALPFIRDGFVRLELVWLFGPRSWRSYGY